MAMPAAASSSPGPRRSPPASPRTPHLRTIPDPVLNPSALSPDDAIAQLPSVAATEGSLAALSLFRSLSARPDLRHLMRLYATAATLFLARGNLPMAQESARAMVSAFAELGRIREAADMVLELRSHGLPLGVEAANWVLAFSTFRVLPFLGVLFGW